MFSTPGNAQQICKDSLNTNTKLSKQKEYALKYMEYKPDFKPYFKTTFSPNFTKWAKGDFIGTSSGNGAMMRVSPIGYLFNNEKDIIDNVSLATTPSHNDKTAINNASIVALIIYYARMGMNKKEIISKLNLNISKPQIETFNYTCADTLDVCLYSLFNAQNFEDSIRLRISFGGDTDTNACIVGSMAEAMYGIPEYLKKQALDKLPSEFIDVLNKAYAQSNNFLNNNTM